jgi:hypothetical protein
MIVFEADSYEVRAFVAYGRASTARFIRALYLLDMARASRIAEPLERTNDFLAAGTTLDEARRKLGLVGGWVH